MKKTMTNTETQVAANSFVKKPKSELMKNLQMFLGGDLSGISENLISRVKYTVDRPLSKVTAKDLAELCIEVSEAIKKAVKASRKRPAEASLKKPAGKKTSTAPKTEEPSEDEKPSAKAATKKSLKKSGVKTAAPLSPKSETPVIMFPDTIEDEELGTLVKVADKFHSYDELCEFLGDGEKQLYFATYWDARLIKQYDYAKLYDVPCPKEFPNDLDLLVALLTCENVERVYAMSRYTEAMFAFNGDDLAPIKSKTPSGEEYEIRVSNGMEYEIYVPEE